MYFINLLGSSFIPWSIRINLSRKMHNTDDPISKDSFQMPNSPPPRIGLTVCYDDALLDAVLYQTEYTATRDVSLELCIYNEGSIGDRKYLIIVPSTLEPNVHIEFFLRLFCFVFCLILYLSYV